jgi:hypothetical protein
MTYGERFEQLRLEFHVKGERLINAEKGLSSILGWGDSGELNDFINAKSEFDEISREYHSFIEQVKQGNIDSATEFRPVSTTLS